MMLENLRFYAEEEKPSKKFAKDLASLGDVYVNDAFATSHRNHTSVAIVPVFFPKTKFFGRLLATEIESLEAVLNNKLSPFTAIIGGAKVSTKFTIIKSLLNKVDNMIIGGGMAFTFIKALGGEIGDSIVEENMIEEAREIVKETMLKGVNLYLPTDAIIADAFSSEANISECPADKIPDGWMGLDIGTKSRRRFAEIINNSNKILWNGPMGVFEMNAFMHGTKSIAVAVAGATTKGSYTLIGGGDSVAAINKYHLGDMISYVSTGGGAMLEYIEGKKLPGIEALRR